MEENQHNELSVSIPEFYKGRSVLVTGFTGALGKVLVEKILYSCPKVNKIYVLIRAKKGQSPGIRIKETLKSMAFRRIREKYPGMLESKVIGIAGDIMADNLGLSTGDEELLRREVSIILYGAASVRFDNPIDVAFNQNTLGVKRMVDLALTMSKLESFIFISTAYSNCDNLFVEEKMYPAKEDWRNIEKIFKKLDTSTVRILTEKYLDKLPNTYILSKSMSEQVINENRTRLPVAIVRPSIVVPAAKEPASGWTDNQYGPVTYTLGFLLGIVRCSWVDVKQICNYIASDIVVNATLIQSWKTALQYKGKGFDDAISICNICSPDSFNMDHEEFSELYKKGKIKDILIKNKINNISLMFIKNKTWYRINVFVRHFISAAFVDFILVLMKKRPMILSIRRKVFEATASLFFFSSRTFEFETSNFHKLKDILKPEDKESFSWDFEEISLLQIYENAFMELQHTLLKPLFEDLPTNSKRLLMLYVIDKGAVVLTCSLLAWIIYTLSIPQSLFTFFTGISF